MAKKEQVLFREVQKNNNVFVWVITVGLAALMWYGFVQQIVFGHPFGDNPAPDAMVIIFLGTMDVVALHFSSVTLNSS